MKWFYTILKVAIGIVGLAAVLNASVIYAVAQSRPDFERADAAIILGAAINTPALTNRTTEALRLYQEGKIDKLVLSGGKIADTDISEAQYMEKIIKRFSEGEVRYLLEDQSHNTHENIRNSKQKLAEVGQGTDSSVVIVSDEFHLARGVLMAKRAGFETVYWSAPEPSYYSSDDLRFYYLREFFAMIAYIPKFILG